MKSLPNNDGVVFLSDGHFETAAGFTYDKDADSFVIGDSNTKVGFFGATPAARPSAYTLTNHTDDKTLDCDGAVAVVADCLGNVIDDLITLGILQGTVSA